MATPLELEGKRIQEERWRQLAGDLLPELLRSREEAMRNLRHASAGVRDVAIQVLSYRWKAYGDNAFAQSCQELAVKDEDRDVRHAALLALGGCYECSDDAHIGAVLAAIVKDEGELEMIRLAAYLSLLSVRRPMAKLSLNPYFDLKDIDWAFVDDSLNRSRPVVPVDRLAALLDRTPPQRVAAYRVYTEAVEALERGDNERSLQFFSQALQLEPNAGGAHLGRARANLALGDVDAAIGDLTRAIELNPKSFAALRERARAHRMKGATGFAERDEQAAAAIEARDEPSDS